MLTMLVALALAPDALADRAEDNVVAFAKLAGVVQYFHPSDGAVGLDWDRFLIENVTRVENAKDSEQLAAMLEETFQRFAPTVQVWAGGVDEAPEPIAVSGGTHRVTSTMSLGDHPIHQPLEMRFHEVSLERDPEHWVSALASGISARVPLSVRADEAGTLPRTEPSKLSFQRRPGDWSPVIAFRKTRAATVITLFNVLRLFDPNLVVSEADWELALRAALRKSALDEDAPSFSATLRMLVAASGDAFSEIEEPWQHERAPWPLDIRWLSGEWVVTHALEGVAAAGAAVRSVDGRPVADYFADLERELAAPSKSWSRLRCADALVERVILPSRSLELESLDGEGKLVEYPIDAPYPPLLPEARRFEEVSPGISYLDATYLPVEVGWGLTDELAGIRALIVDLRSRTPELHSRRKRIFGSLAVHLVESQAEKRSSGDPGVVFRGPEDPKRRDADRSITTVEPKSPCLTGHLAVLIDGRTVADAEILADFVARHHLGELIGEATAGGDAVLAKHSLPGGYSVVWNVRRPTTEERGRGLSVSPTIPVKPTRAGIATGRDEVLEKAIEVLSAKLGR